jgi:hypothetical protein
MKMRALVVLLMAGVLAVCTWALLEHASRNQAIAHVQILDYTAETSDHSNVIRMSLVISNAGPDSMYFEGWGADEPSYLVYEENEASRLFNPVLCGTGLWWRELTEGTSVQSEETIVVSGELDAVRLLAVARHIHDKRPKPSTVGRVLYAIPFCGDWLGGMWVRKVWNPGIASARSQEIHVTLKERG